MNLKDKRVLVTGGAGVIGRELVRRLLDEGSTVLVLDKYKTLSDVDLDWDWLVVLMKDLSAPQGWQKTVESFEPEAVFHLAATFQRTVESPLFFADNWTNNVVAGHNLLRLVMDLPSLERFVFASSYLVYDPSLYLSDDPDVNPRFLKEDDPINPRNLCGMAKLYTEREMEFVKRSLPGLKTVGVRIFRVYGEGSNDVISRWVSAALQGDEIEVYNGRSRFDYVYAGDVAEGLVRLVRSDAEGIVNLGFGASTEVRTVLGILGSKVPSIKVKDGDDVLPYERSAAEVEKLLSKTGWLPRVNLDEGIGKVVEYQKSQGWHEE